MTNRQSSTHPVTPSPCLLVSLLLALLLLTACEGAAIATPAPETIVIGGATATRRVMRDLSDAYRRQHPNVLFDLRSGGSTLGEEGVRRKELNLATSTLLPPDPSSGTPVPAGDELLVRTPIGLDGLALVVHATNPIEALSLVQLRDIYGGRVLNWLAVGSDAGEILLISREDGSGSRILFEGRVMDGERVALTAVVMPTSADVVDYVAKNPQAIGYVSGAEVAEFITESAEGKSTAPTDAPPVKVLAVEGLLPTIENLRSQQYALTQPIYLISNGAPAGRLRNFVDFVLSPTGQAIVGRYHAPIRE
jgi:phosphate transport system substrate-binding protein